MENASKALIIAGAVLVSILLITFGVMIMSSTGGTQDTVKQQTDSMAIQTFNSQFLQYEGTQKSAEQVRQLLSSVKASNGANASHQIKIYKGSSGTVALASTGIVTGTKYTVAITYGTDGYISIIRVY